MIKSKYIVTALAGALGAGIVVAKSDNQDWEEVLDSFETYKNDLIAEKSKAVVKICGEKTEEVNLNTSVVMNDNVDSIDAIFNSLFFDFKRNTKNNKTAKNKKNGKTAKEAAVKGEKKIKLSTQGIIISKDGYIITPYSSIEGCHNLYVEVGEKTYKINGLLYDEYYDIALLKIKTGNFPFVTVDSSCNKINEKYLYSLTSNIACVCTTTITTPEKNEKAKGKNKKKNSKYDTKKKNNKDRKVNEKFSYNETFEQSLLKPGFFINLQGNLVGMTVGKGKGTENCIGARPCVLEACDIYNVVKVLKKEKKYVHDICGLGIVNNSKNLAKKKSLKTKHGCVVVQVNGSRKKEGFSTGDVIIEINHCKISNIFDFYSVFNASKNYDMVFTVLRKDEEKHITVPCGKMSPVKFNSSEGNLTFENYTFKELTATQKTLLKKNNVVCGILVQPNKHNLPIERDFIITAIDHYKICSVDFVKNYVQNFMQKQKNREIKDLNLLVEGYYLDDLSQKKMFAINLL